MAVDNSPWDASKAWANGAAADDPAAFYNGICAGKKAGDPKTQGAHALPYKYHPGDGPNKAGVSAALGRFNQTEGLTNATEAKATLEKAQAECQAASDNDGDEKADSSPRAMRALRSQEIPGGHNRTRSFPGELRSKIVQRDGRQLLQVEGYATVFNRSYAMWDMFGSYNESMDSTSLNKSMAGKPDVSFLVNHKGVTMARTTNGSLNLSLDTTGLHCEAYLNIDRQDVRDLASAINDELVNEMSFAFMLDDGVWDDDFANFRITEADINRGDVSAVNYGANPFTSIAARASDWLEDLDRMPDAVRREAFSRMERRMNQLATLPPAPEVEPDLVIESEKRDNEPKLGKTLTLWQSRLSAAKS